MNVDFHWPDSFALDVRLGFLADEARAPRQHHPQVVLNGPNDSVLRTLRLELARCSEFLFSVAFVSPRALALLKQELVDFSGTGRIITSDYLGFNSPAAFTELLNLTQLDVDVRIHSAAAFHPKGYIFRNSQAVTAMVGSSNLTENALVTNHEWNLKVTAAIGSDLASQFSSLVQEQIKDSVPLTAEWIAQYAASYSPPGPRRRSVAREQELATSAAAESDLRLAPNKMQSDALRAIDMVRSSGEARAIVISATGTGKTILSALDVRAFNPKRLLFIVHREQILDRTIEEYQRVLGGPASDYGKLSGGVKQRDARYLFATVQTLSQPDVLATFGADHFDYLILDEAHRAAAPTHQRILNHFTPKFTLGMTATPERMDGFNVFELFDFNVPYEIRLNHALEEDMLCPFHYYGVADVTLATGETLTDDPDLKVLISEDRVDHLIRAIEVYGQASVPPRGLIFCSRKDEARALSAALNTRTLRGTPLRTVAMTGDDSIADREAAVARLERGELDYILTVDVFNEGVDIPTVNQVIMLRQTQSAVVFVQQLGRGLRKAPGKEYVVVLDFIGNYTNNFLIPIALFGDESLNKESLKQRMIAAEESGVLPGLASVRFDRIAQQRVLQSIVSARLDSLQNLKRAIETMRNRLGRVPALTDFLRFESADPVLLATKVGSYPALIERLLKIPSQLTAYEKKILEQLSQEVLTAKRAHEFVLLEVLMNGRDTLTRQEVAELFAERGLVADDLHVASAIDTLTLAEHPEVDRNRYRTAAARTVQDDQVRLDPTLASAYATSAPFRTAVDDVIKTGQRMVHERYDTGDPFVPSWQYSRKEVTRLLCWPRKWTSTLYGYRVGRSTGTCAIFVTLHKSADITASTAYEDELLDPSTMIWYTRSRRTLESDEVRAIVDNDVDLHVFMKKDDAEGSDFYYLGRARSSMAEETTMPDSSGRPLSVVRMNLRFDHPIMSALYDYFHPTLEL